MFAFTSKITYNTTAEKRIDTPRWAIIYLEYFSK